MGDVELWAIARGQLGLITRVRARDHLPRQEAAGPGAVASHRTAAELWGMGGVVPASDIVTTVRALRARPPAQV